MWKLHRNKKAKTNSRHRHTHTHTLKYQKANRMPAKKNFCLLFYFNVCPFHAQCFLNCFDNVFWESNVCASACVILHNNYNVMNLHKYNSMYTISENFIRSLIVPAITIKIIAKLYNFQV